MPIPHRPYLLLILTLVVTAAAAIVTSPPPQPQPAAASPDSREEEIAHILDAIIGTGDFGSWAGVISSAVLPLSSTIFIPEDNSSSPSGDPFRLPYHVIPQRLTFQELLQFRTHARLPTLLPGRMLLVTNNSRYNFTIDGSRVTLPDVLSTSTFTVHGVESVFDYSVYGDGLVAAPPAVPKPLPEDQSQLTSKPRNEVSRAAPPCLCNKIPPVFLAVCVVLGFKIHRRKHLGF